VSAEVAYSADDSRWNFPSIYYTKSFTDEESGYKVDIVMIDTVDLSGSTGVSDESDARYFDKLPTRARSEAAEQWAWIEKSISESTADFLLVGGHYPVYSACDHGNSQNLIDNLQPLLVQYEAHYLVRMSNETCKNEFPNFLCSLVTIIAWNTFRRTVNLQYSFVSISDLYASLLSGVHYFLSGAGHSCCYESSNSAGVPEGYTLRY
jgi:hypothetical protein